MNATVSKIKFVVLALIALSVVHCSKGGGGGATSTATTCPASQIYTTGMGCLPSCGAAMVYVNNQCVSAYSVTTATGYNGINSGIGNTCNPTYINGQMSCSGTVNGGISGGIGGIGNQNICSGSCGYGAVQTNNGCLPQGQCGPCYGQNNGWCYIGTNAHQYYGY